MDNIIILELSMYLYIYFYMYNFIWFYMIPVKSTLFNIFINPANYKL